MERLTARGRLPPPYSPGPPSAAFLGSPPGNTLRADQRGLPDFARWCADPAVERAVGLVLAAGHDATDEAALR